MATRAQIKANHKNAKKSTGPRTDEGKARVAKNALKHGLLARDTVLPGEACDLVPEVSFLDGQVPAPQAALTRTTKQTQSRRTPVKSTVARAFLRAVSPLVATSIPVVAHALNVPRRDSSRRLEPTGRRPRNTARATR